MTTTQALSLKDLTSEKLLSIAPRGVLEILADHHTKKLLPRYAPRLDIDIFYNIVYDHTYGLNEADLVCLVQNFYIKFRVHFVSCDLTTYMRSNGISFYHTGLHVMINGQKYALYKSTVEKLDWETNNHMIEFFEDRGISTYKHVIMKKYDVI